MRLKERGRRGQPSWCLMVCLLALLGLGLVGVARAEDDSVASIVDNAAVVQAYFGGSAQASDIVQQEVQGAGAWKNAAKQNEAAAQDRTETDAATEEAVAETNSQEAAGEQATEEKTVEGLDALREKGQGSIEALKSMLEESTESIHKAGESAKEEITQKQEADSKQLEESVSKVVEQQSTAEQAIEKDEQDGEQKEDEMAKSFEDDITKMEEEAEQKIKEAADKDAADRKEKEDAMATELQAAVAASTEDRGRLEVMAKRAAFHFESAKDENEAQLDGKFGNIGVVKQRLTSDAEDSQKESAELTDEEKKVADATAEARADMASLAKAARVYRIAEADAAARAAAQERIARRTHLATVLAANRKLAHDKAIELAKLRAQAVVQHRWEIENALRTQSDMAAEDARAEAARLTLAGLKARRIQTEGLLDVTAKEHTHARAALAQRQIAYRQAQQRALLEARTARRLQTALLHANQNVNQLAAFEAQRTRDIALATEAAKRATWAAAQKAGHAHLGKRLRQAILQGQADAAETAAVESQYMNAQATAAHWQQAHALQQQQLAAAAAAQQAALLQVPAVGVVGAWNDPMVVPPLVG